jgi:hypothetical protein
MLLASPTAHSLGERETFLVLEIIQHRSNNTFISYTVAAQCLIRFHCYLTAESPTMYIPLIVVHIRDVYCDVVLCFWSTTHNYTSHWSYDHNSTLPTMQTQF